MTSLCFGFEVFARIEFGQIVFALKRQGASANTALVFHEHTPAIAIIVTAAIGIAKIAIMYKILAPNTINLSFI